MRHLKGIAFTLFALAGLSGLMAAQPISIEEVLKAPTLAAYSPPEFSPDGRFLAYVVTDNARRRNKIDLEAALRTGVTWFGIASDIWISDLRTGERHNITNGGNNWAPKWSPDGRYLAFLGDRSGGTEIGPPRVWIWDRSTGKLRQVSDTDVRGLGINGVDWTGDGRSLVVSLFPEELGRAGYIELMKGKPTTAPEQTDITV